MIFSDNRDNAPVLMYSLFYIIFIPILSRIILKEKFAKHNMVSIIISFLGLIIISIIDIKKMTNDDIRDNIIALISGFLTSLHYVFLKYLIEVYSISNFLAQFIIGVIRLVLIIFFYLIYSYQKIGDLSEITNSFNFWQYSNKDYIMLSLFFISYTCSENFKYIILYKFSPSLLITTNLVGETLSLSIESFDKEETGNIILTCFGFFAAFIASLIYNEIIILNFCGLNKYTTKHIKIRSDKDKSLAGTLSYDDETSVEEPFT